MKSLLLLAGLAGSVAAGPAKRHEHAPKVVYPCPDCPKGYQPPPVTITKQYQVVPTCKPAHGKPGHMKCSDYTYVHTVVKDAKGKDCTVTKTDDAVTLCYTKTAIPHTSTYTASGSYATESVYYEHHERTCEAPYEHVGPIGLPGYKGSGLCGAKCHGENGAKYQPVQIKDCYDGKCTTYMTTYTHAAPGPMTTSYDQPGTYTISDYDVTVTKPYTTAAEAVETCEAHKAYTYGGVSTSVSAPTTVTAGYPAYKKVGSITKTYIATTTKVCPSAGEYTIVPPTTTTYDHATTMTYPTVKVYPTGVYHHSHEVVTITKPGQPYTCTLEDHPSSYPTKTYPSNPDPSADYSEPSELYGRADPGYSTHGGIIKRADVGAQLEDAWAAKRKRVILV